MSRMGWSLLKRSRMRGGGGCVAAWLRAHDAEVRASVLAEQGEPDWEYGISSGCGSVDYVGTRESVEARVASFEKAGAPLRPPESIVRRRKVGLWLPVEENGENDG